MKRYLPLVLLGLVLAGCDAFSDTMSAHQNVVARVGQHELTVDEMVDLLAANPRIPAQTEVVSSVADLWVDYTALAELVAEDSTLSGLDLQALLRPYVQQRTFAQLRDQVVTSDTILTDAELRQLYQEQAPGVRVKARHILIAFPDNPTEAQRDSVHQLAEQIRQRAVSGEDFAKLAKEYSDDPGSAQQGGELGWFERGRMVKPFEDAAFSLKPGEISPVVETPFGLHIIQVEERETPSLDEIGPEFRQRAIQQRQQESLNAYVDSLTSPVGMEVKKGALDVARDLARNASAELRGRAAERELVTWKGGSMTARELLEFLRQMPPQQRAQLASMQDEQLSSLLKEVATNELVLLDAESRGITVPQQEQDSIARLMRQQIVRVADQAGLAGEPQEGEAEAQAIDRRVRSLLEGILSGQQNLLPLGGLSFVLRDQVDSRIYEQSFPVVVDRLQERRAATTDTTAPQPGQPMPQPGQPQPTAPDTGAAGG